MDKTQIALQAFLGQIEDFEENVSIISTNFERVSSSDNEYLKKAAIEILLDASTSVAKVNKKLYKIRGIVDE